MLLRDNLRPREKAHHFDCCYVQLRDGKSVYAERHVTESDWFVCLNLKPIEPDQLICVHEEDRIDHEDLDEFEAQAVLDYYVAEYGLLEEVT